MIDEARHVEVYSRYLHEKIELVYPLNPNLKSLLDDVISDSRWDMTYLGMQVLIEGLALAAFGLIRNMATDPLAKAINAYVMQDEARHVMFGRLALRDYYPQLTAGRARRARGVLRRRLLPDARPLPRRGGLGARSGCPTRSRSTSSTSELQRTFRGFLFMRIVPILKDIGLWGPRIQRAFTDMGVHRASPTPTSTPRWPRTSRSRRSSTGSRTPAWPTSGPSPPRPEPEPGTLLGPRPGVGGAGSVPAATARSQGAPTA